MLLDPPLASPMISRLTIIGIGLIGSSILRAAKTRGLAGTVVAYDASEAVRDRALALGLADIVASTPEQAVRDSDIVILCVPVGAMSSIGAQIAPHLKADVIVSDVGSVKGAVLAALRAQLPEGLHARIIPGHPVAGTEYSGPDAGFATLFKNRWCILTPPEGADAVAVGQLSALWTAMGANVETMTAEHHDLVLAITSHVPHLIAYNIVGTAADLEAVTNSEVIKFSAGGFRDFTRIAASDPTMWRDVFLNNREAVIEVLGRFTEDLIALQRAIRWEQGDALFDLFTRTRAIRRSIIEQGQETAAPDFGRERE